MGASTRTRSRTTRTHELELQHRENMHKTDMIGRDEEARLLRLKLLAARDETAALELRISQKEEIIAALTEKSDALHAELGESRKAARAQETRMKKRDVELANLQAEVDSLNGSMQDSSKAIQEKFALSRELERLRPEMAHLKSQLANYQAMVAEKNDLRRQLDSLEVELENEKRSRQRAQLKEDDAAMAGLKSRLEKAEKKLAVDGNEREKAKAEFEKKLAEAQVLAERLEERVESLRGKYKASQGELKETKSRLEACQAELQGARKAAGRGAKESAANKSVTVESGLNRKRRAQDMSYDNITIQTPGNQDAAVKRAIAKKRGVEQAAVGEKSTFSITPFLKRTKDLSDESLEEASANETLDGAGPDSTFAGLEFGTGPSGTVVTSNAETDGSDPVTGTDAASKRKPPSKAPSKPAPRPRGRPRTKGLAEASPAEVNKAIQKAERAPKKAALGTVAEVSGGEEQENASAKAPEPQPKGPEGDAKKKKRKLLGAASQALLGDEEDEPAAAKALAKPVLAPGKKPRLQLGGGGVRNAFAGAAFSPLKRDRRGVNASFLA